MPEVPAPLAYRTFLHLVRNGGILTCLDRASARSCTTPGGSRASGGRGPGRHPDPPGHGNPLEAGLALCVARGRWDKLYLASGDGLVTGLSTGFPLEVLARKSSRRTGVSLPSIRAGRDVRANQGCT